jgi:hypothetical protein
MNPESHTLHPLCWRVMCAACLWNLVPELAAQNCSPPVLLLGIFPECEMVGFGCASRNCLLCTILVF